MSKNFSRVFATVGMAAAMAIGAGAPAAADWPERPLKVIVPFAPGGTSDTMARIVQRAIADEQILPQPISVVNVGGRHFSVGAIQAKNEVADGSAFLLLHIALLTGEAAGVVTDVSYRDFEHVAVTGGTCLTPIVHRDAPWETLEELMEEARANPDSLIFGVNIGAINHAAGVFMEETYEGAKFRFVQIGGGAENYAALIGGQTQVGVISASEYSNFRDGDIRALGYTGAERHPDIPELETMREQGLDFTFCIENYWFAPPGTPEEAVAGMADALEQALQTDAVREAFKAQYTDPVFMRGDEMTAHLDRIYEEFLPIAEAMVR
jgi:putative tricarboxylic transport membrane protein